MEEFGKEISEGEFVQGQVDGWMGKA